MKTDLFQSYGHCWVLQIFWHIECSIFTALSFRISNSSSGIPSPPLAVLISTFKTVLFSSVQLLSRVQLFETLWIAACQASLSISNSQSLLRLMSIESVMPSNHLILCCPLLLLPSIFLASGSFPMSQFFPSGDQTVGATFIIQNNNRSSWAVQVILTGLHHSNWTVCIWCN